ncbi:hypothetical protein AJ78_08186 [Emergomyces pasteurianus Ep9510]|uniref:Uncharacterized protein n=1 Tax=Emergomyces pasteurianus Ep9510 TaxID=1447872 RepID=A0A1J9P2E4_9EURO|nr:hypothetical protein AJ78_08186 [Emergomyces pasteurianus Ep9510]
MSGAPLSHLEELSLSKIKLKTWITAVHKMQETNCISYEHSSEHSWTPEASRVQSDRYWIENKLSKWTDFSRELPRMDHVDGAHYTMMSPEHIFTFQNTIRKSPARTRTVNLMPMYEEEEQSCSTRPLVHCPGW